MATQLQIRRGSDSQVSAFTGAEGEIVVNTTNDSIHVNDGSTAGGFELARVDGSNWNVTNDIDITGTVTADGLVTQATANTYPAGAAIIKSLAGDASYVTNVGGTFLISNNSTSDQFALTSGGRVGIGTSSPTTALQIVGLNQTNGTLDLTPNAAKGSFASYVHYGTNGDWYIRSANASGNIILQDTGGNVGIGTSSPDSPLEIQAATNSSSDTTYLKLFNAGENVGHIDFENGNGSLARITGTKEGAGASANDGILTFSTAFDTSLSERMRIDSSGNVTVKSAGELRIRDDGTFIKEDQGLQIGNTSGTGTTRPIRFFTESAERMRISSAGYVTTPQNPYFRGSYNGSNLAATAVIPQNANIANRNMTHSGGNTITVPVAGRYLIAHHQLGVASGTQTLIRINGVNVAGSFTQMTGAANGSISTVFPIELAASDYVQFVVYAGSIHGNPNYSFMSVTFIG